MDTVIPAGKDLNPTEALAGIPGWEHANVAPLPGGLTNRAYLVTRGSERAVLKIDAHPRQAPFNSRAEEARIQRLAAACGLAGPVLHASSNAILTGFVEGQVWTPAALRDAGNLAVLARALRRLHELPLTGRLFDANGAARRYARCIRDQGLERDPEMVNHCLRVVAAMPRPGKLCCCHNDLVAANIVAASDIRFLDWEYACDNDPFFDLATIVAHHDLSTPVAERFLEAYFDGKGERWREHLLTYERGYDALHWLWQASRQADT